MKEVSITVSPDGGVVDIDAEGFTGSSCKDFLKLTMEALGSVEQERRKPEFFRSEHTGVKVVA